MTIKETYTGLFTKLELFQTFQFLAFTPNVDIDKKHNTITFSDPNDVKNVVVFDTENLAVHNGEITAGTIVDVDFVSKGKHALTLTGLDLEANALQAAAMNGGGGLYDFVIGGLDGNLVAKGDKYDNILEVGQGGKATVDAGGGNDMVYIWHNKNAVIDGGKGADSIDFNNLTGDLTATNHIAKVDLAKGTGTNPFGGTLTLENIENVINMFNGSSDFRGDDQANFLRVGSAVSTVMGRGGDDEISVRANFSVDPRATLADGGSGTDQLDADLSEAPGAPSTGTGSTLRFHNKLDLEHPDDNTGTFHGGTFANFEKFQVYGFLDKDVFEFSGSNAAEQVFAAGADDVLNGRGGDDMLIGYKGADVLTGGAGADQFQYQTLTDSTAGATGRDTIEDFSHAQHDKIDLHLMFASQNFGGVYDFIGGKKFDGRSSEVRFVHNGTDTIVYVDDNADKAADMAILLDHGPAKLVAGDFLL